MTDFFKFGGYELPVDLVNKTGGGPESFADVSEWHIKQLQQYIGIKDTDHVVEVGCGIGRDAIPLTSILTRGAYLGTDTIQPSIRWCTENIAARHPNFRFIHHDIHDTLHNPSGTLKALDIKLPLEAGVVDLIILQSVFTHMFAAEIIHYLKEFERVLKPSGRIWATFFLVDEPLLRGIRANPPTRWSLSFHHPYGNGCYVNGLDEPRGAVAFEEARLHQMLQSADLMLARDILWGAWSGYRQNPTCGQDGVILMRRSS